MQLKFQKYGIARFRCSEVYSIIVIFNGVFFEVVLQGSFCAEILYIKWAGFLFLPSDEADVPGLQRRDLSNSQMGALCKSIFLHYALFEISQQAG